MNYDHSWKPLPGGSVNAASLKDNVVRRQLTNVSPAIHQLLEYLKVKNFPCVPRLINYDDRYEYLSYLPGKAILRPWCNAIKTDDFIRQLGKWLRDYHEVITGFRLQGDVQFNWGVTSPEDQMIVCHGDLGPWNCIEQNGKFQGMIDWDLAHYGYIMDNIAEFVFEFIPLHPRLNKTIGQVSDKVLLRRLAIFCEAYQEIKPDKILEYIPIYLTRMNSDLRKQANLGIEPFVSFVARGIADNLDRDRDFVGSHWLK